jgi:predicted amidohydrolase
LDRIREDGVPAGRRSRGYCLVEGGRHFPPKYAIALANQIVRGHYLRGFSGGRETNHFLDSRGFVVVECGCGGAPSARALPPRSLSSRKPRRSVSSSRPVLATRPRRHSERCAECKVRVRELLEALYGECRPNLRFRWPARLSAYHGTPLYSALRRIAAALEAHRGFSVSDFVRTSLLAPSDFWVPDPGFLVEFDESQHFTHPRKLALAAYPEHPPPGFAPPRWISLCERYDARDNDPPYRDEQRAWYDTLRDLVPSLHGLRPTVRLHAGDLVWCSLDPDSEQDLSRFAAAAGLRGNSSEAAARTRAGPRASVLRAALVFPETYRMASAGVPPTGAGAQEPRVPTVADFAGETVDFVLFPEAYIRSGDAPRRESLRKLSAALDAPLLVGAVDEVGGRASQILLRFDPDGSEACVYAKHSTAGLIAFEKDDWVPDVMLPTFEIRGANVGATICHDHYLGLLPRFLARRGARVWVNPSYDNVTEIKWSSILRLRAVENRLYALCTLHDDVSRNRTHPFAFAPDGTEVPARQAGESEMLPLSECPRAGRVLLVELDLNALSAPLDWKRVPLPAKPQRPRTRPARRPVRIAWAGGRAVVRGRSGWEPIRSDCRVETDYGALMIGGVRDHQVLDAAVCFRILDRACEADCFPVIWNHWDRLPTDSGRLATLMMGRAIECCAPVVLSDQDGIHELVELAGNYKIPARRSIEASGEATMDLTYARGLRSAFGMVTKHLPRRLAERALNRYRQLA